MINTGCYKHLSHGIDQPQRVNAFFHFCELHIYHPVADGVGINTEVARFLYYRINISYSRINHLKNIERLLLAVEFGTHDLPCFAA